MMFRYFVLANAALIIAASTASKLKRQRLAYAALAVALILDLAGVIAPSL
jgi:hypothetical protein